MSQIFENIVIDVGNSSIKVGHFRKDQLIDDWICKDFDHVVKSLAKKHSHPVMICSVAADVSPLVKMLEGFQIKILSPSTPIPFECHYTTINTLGLDRIAALAGAEKINQGKNNLVIDIGSCITYDFLDKNNRYLGGSISPGVELRFKSMHNYTKRLPLITNYDNDNLIGDSTESAMVSGVINGIIAEMEGIIGRYQGIWPGLEVIMCGRGSNRFESKLKAPIFASPKLVLIGLNRILEYNEQS